MNFPCIRCYLFFLIKYLNNVNNYLITYNERKKSFDSRAKLDNNDNYEEDDFLEMVDCDLSFNEEKKEIAIKEFP